jgi:hypothetical protein
VIENTVPAKVEARVCMRVCGWTGVERGGGKHMYVVATAMAQRRRGNNSRKLKLFAQLAPSRTVRAAVLLAEQVFVDHTNSVNGMGTSSRV